MKAERATLWGRMFIELAVVWPFLEPTKDRVRVWDAALSDLSEAQVREGAARLIANHGAPTPTPGELRDAVLGSLTWETTRHPIDGRVMGRKQVRALAAKELPAPQELIDLDRAPLALPGKAGEIVRELSSGMVPTAKSSASQPASWAPIDQRGPQWCRRCGYENRTGSTACQCCSRPLGEARALPLATPEETSHAAG